MRQETYRFALDQASAELRDIVAKFEALRSRKEQIETVVEALRPFIGLQSGTATIEASPAIQYADPAHIPAAHAESAYVEPAFAEPSYAESPYAESAYAEPAYAEPAYAEPVYAEPAYIEPVIEQSAPEPQFTFMQISSPGMEVVITEPAPVEPEEVLEPVHAMEEATAEQIAYFRQPSADPFQRRIDDALWGWQQRPEGLLSPI